MANSWRGHVLPSSFPCSSFSQRPSVLAALSHHFSMDLINTQIHKKMIRRNILMRAARSCTTLQYAWSECNVLNPTVGHQAAVINDQSSSSEWNSIHGTLGVLLPAVILRPSPPTANPPLMAISLKRPGPSLLVFQPLTFRFWPSATINIALPDLPISHSGTI